MTFHNKIYAESNITWLSAVHIDECIDDFVTWLTYPLKRYKNHQQQLRQKQYYGVKSNHILHK